MAIYLVLNSKNLTKSQTLDTDVIIYGAPFEGESTWEIIQVSN